MPLRRPRPGVATGVARLAGVRRVHFPNQDTRFAGFVLDAPGETREHPIVEAAVHPLALSRDAHECPTALRGQ